MGRPKKNRFFKRRTKRVFAKAASPLKCPKCRAAAITAEFREQVLVQCSAGCPEFWVTKPKYIQDESPEL